jgi:glycine/D-amino acid oxidase-like deaminating enzyme
MKKPNQTQDLVIIGGGIMGLMTAYYASAFTRRVSILEKRTLGNKEAASFSYTRSMRTDYLDPLYVRLALEAQGLWRELQRESGKQLFVECGCLNIASKAITSKLADTYAAKSYEVISELNLSPERFTKQALQGRFPQFAADLGCLDTKGGYLNLRAITALLADVLKSRGVTIEENVETDSVSDDGNAVSISTNKGVFTAKKLVITAGMWTNDVLRRIKGSRLVLPITLDKPKECKYYYPAPEKREQFLPENCPVFAYLDIGIYGHPIFDKAKGAVKISYYNPTDFTGTTSKPIQSVADFVRECMPLLQDARSEDVKDADQCFYDLPKDDHFILGNLPGSGNIFVGTGWRGTGYKFAPFVGKTLAQLALNKGTVYDISTFSPGRFTK